MLKIHPNSQRQIWRLDMEQIWKHANCACYQWADKGKAAKNKYIFKYGMEHWGLLKVKFFS